MSVAVLSGFTVETDWSVEWGRSLSTLHVSLSFPDILSAASLRSLSLSHKRDAMSKPQGRASRWAVYPSGDPGLVPQ